MKKPVSPCLDCEIRMERCHEFCPMYRQYTKLQAEYRKYVKEKRFEINGQRVAWPESRYRDFRK